jgi:mRNA interferase RelE/StbE
VKVSFKPTFLKDCEKLPSNIREKVLHVSIEVFPAVDSMFNLPIRVKRLSGYNDYYSFRLGDYRVGFKVENDSRAVFMRALHRKDIYRKFP